MATQGESVSAGLPNRGDGDSNRGEGTVHVSGQVQAASSQAATSYVGPPPRLPKGQYTNEEVENVVQPVGHEARLPVGTYLYTDGVVRPVEDKAFAPSPVGDPNSGAKGSGARYNSGKAPLSMVPLHLLEGAARVFHKATVRPRNPYPKWNWAKGMQWSVPYECMLRHLAAWYRGEEVDADTGESHLDLAHCNLLMLIHYAEAYKEGDDRPDAFTIHPKAG